jgi:hypothetical protein
MPQGAVLTAEVGSVAGQKVKKINKSGTFWNPFYN